LLEGHDLSVFLGVITSFFRRLALWVVANISFKFPKKVCLGDVFFFALFFLRKSDRKTNGKFEKRFVSLS